MASGQLVSQKLSATDRVRLATLQIAMDEHRIRVGQNIRARREELGWSVPTTARKLPVADKTLERWERGETFGHMSNLEKLAEVLQTTVPALMADADDEPKATPDLSAALNGNGPPRTDELVELREQLQRIEDRQETILKILREDVVRDLAAQRRRAAQPSAQPQPEQRQGSRQGQNQPPQDD